MSDTSHALSLPLLAPAQAQKHVTHNEALLRLDLLVQAAVSSRSRTAPPETPDEGETHIVATPASGAWAGQEGALARFETGAWRFAPARPGWRVWVADEARLFVHDGVSWAPVRGATENLPSLGVNAAADAHNRLTVSAEATLLTHEGGDHRLKINKADAGATASVLFQSGWSGRAEFGLAGGDDWTVKVSPDGASWTEALRIDATSGRATGAAVQTSAADATPGRLVAVGGFGLGQTGDIPALADVAATDTPVGLYRVIGSGTANNGDLPERLPGGTGDKHAVMRIERYGGGRLRQTVWSIGTEESALLTRWHTDAGWEPWREVFHQGSVLGPVSQSGGQPTGALIESGSTADGSYARFADGTQICTWMGPAVAAETAAGNLWASAGPLTWTFPAAFAGAPVVSGNADSTTRWIAPGGTTETQVSYRVLSVQSDASELAPYLTAIGRWF
jgi:hypothetical protein